MRSFAEMNPAAVTVHLLLTACITIFCMEPVLLGISLCAAIAFYLMKNGPAHRSFHLFALGVPALFAVLNPLWNQHGSTVLFVINHRAYTAEALCYGGVTGIRLAAVLYWFRIFSEMTDSEKLFYLFRFLSPRIAMVLSMAIRNLTLYREQMKKIQQSQRALGLYREAHLIDDVRGGARVFSVLLTWALENGIITANSMSARGYGIGRRTSYVTFRWHLRDAVLLGISAILAAVSIRAVAAGAMHWEFYPVCDAPPHGLLWTAGIGAYLLLSLLPLIYEGKEMLTWKRLRSHI
ncbi:MAG: energy-coupling factor transporter transmembrane protein EcfT [Oscillospiraceae bacterium]|nr:energy-coupling factor transporter transmembrane protein EcfT [Oscillospiraceae bacterium]